MNTKRLPFKLALNASTLFPFNLDIKQQIRVTAEAGYEGIEVWVKDIDSYMENGGTLTQLKKYIDDTGIAVVNGIAFWKWTDADASEREKGFQQAEREMRMLTEIGCAGAAAPPFGEVASVTLDDMARNFAKLAEKARQIGIQPILEFWGRAQKLNRISEAVYVALESGVSEPKLLLDLFHMYTGGSRVDDLKLINGASIGVVHVNDYPAAPPRETIADKDRVFPGDGIGQTEQFAKLLDRAGYAGFLSLELFIQDFGGKTALQVASEGLEKVKRAYSV